jgi:hypothetical protein
VKEILVGNERTKISGHVVKESIRPKEDLVIDIYNPDGTLCKSDNVQVNQNDGTFSYPLVVDCKGRTTGTYRFDISLANGQASGGVFMYITGPYNLTVNGKTFPINYKIDGGKLTDMTIEPEAKSLKISTENATKLTIELPRQVIDSTDGENDLKFAVSVEKSLAYSFDEINPSNETRTILIDLCYQQYVENCDSKMVTTITGTRAVPEFPLMIQPILLAAATIAAISLNAIFGRQAQRYYRG